MACDGVVAPEEVQKIKELTQFKEMDLQSKLDDFLVQLKAEGSSFLKKYLDEVSKSELTTDEECELASIAVQIIEIDKEIEYKEIAFFKKIRKRLHATDEQLLEVIPPNPSVADQIAPEDYLLEDLSDENDFSVWNDTFNDLVIPQQLLQQGE